MWASIAKEVEQLCARKTSMALGQVHACPRSLTACVELKINNQPAVQLLTFNQDGLATFNPIPYLSLTLSLTLTLTLTQTRTVWSPPSSTTSRLEARAARRPLWMEWTVEQHLARRVAVAPAWRVGRGVCAGRSGRDRELTPDNLRTYTVKAAVKAL